MAIAEDRRRVTTRLTIIRVGIAVAFGALACSFWFLQVVQHAQFKEMAENNHQRTLTLRAPRGIIYDRAGNRRISKVGGLEETVNVTAESPIVDLTSKEIGGNITSDTLVKLPSVNVNFVGFVGLLPGIVPSVSTESFGSDSIAVNGQDPRQYTDKHQVLPGIVGADLSP